MDQDLLPGSGHDFIFHTIKIPIHFLHCNTLLYCEYKTYFILLTLKLKYMDLGFIFRNFATQTNKLWNISHGKSRHQTVSKITEVFSLLASQE